MFRLFGAWLRPVERTVRVREVARSNRAAPTGSSGPPYPEAVFLYGWAYPPSRDAGKNRAAPTGSSGPPYPEAVFLYGWAYPPSRDAGKNRAAPAQLSHAGRIMVLEHTTIWHFTAKWSFFARYRNQNQPPPQPSPKIGEGAVFNQSGKEANASFPLWTPHVSENQRLAGSISHDSGLRISPKPQRSGAAISRRANHGSGTHHNLALHRKMEFSVGARFWLLRKTP